MPHFNPPLRIHTAEKPIPIYAGHQGRKHWIYRSLLDCVINDGELLEQSGESSVNWTKYDFDIVGRVVEFLLQFDYSTVLIGDEDEDSHQSSARHSTPQRPGLETRQSEASKKRKRGSPRLSYDPQQSKNSVANHKDTYKAKWDMEEQDSNIPAIGPGSAIDSFLTDAVCKDWMMTIEGNILSEENVEVSHKAIVLHVKLYIFAFAHEFDLLRQVAIQKLVMCLSRVKCTKDICIAIATAVELLDAARYSDIHPQHRNIHEILEHYTALEISTFLREPAVANDGFVMRAVEKLKAWSQRGVEDHARVHQLEGQLAEFTKEKVGVPTQRHIEMSGIQDADMDASGGEQRLPPQTRKRQKRKTT